MRTDALVELLLQNGKYANLDLAEYRADVEAQAKRFRSIPTSQFFVEMMNLYTHYNIEPPEITYKLGKAFLAIYGMNNFIQNNTKTKDLLAPQIIEFYLNRVANDVTSMITSSLEIVPDLLVTMSDKGVIQGLSEQIPKIDLFKQQLHSTLEHCDEVLAFFNLKAR